MQVPVYQLFDIVEMKKEHPCATRTKRFQIVRVGADIKIMCLGCGNVIMLTRYDFNKRIRKVISNQTEIVKINK
ncbi:MAG: DUF951 domain-containing protein [Bacilli bacterium]|jgi:hypothetical protein|nr:DUF951 domain-containing protein [Bacilli bacterium]MDD4005645.1 DUF951 domain-containing protein [Bacilli bacterium]